MAIYFNKEEELEHRIELLEIAMGNTQLAMGECNNKEKAALPLQNVMPSLLDLKFKERRQKLKLNLRAVAMQTNISAATISRIERGQMETQYKIIKKLNDWYCNNGA